MFEFFTLGHAPTPQIHKSVAIQIYFIYKEHFTHKKLLDILRDTSRMKHYSLELNKPNIYSCFIKYPFYFMLLYIQL